jgi:hypothetical protein
MDRVFLGSNVLSMQNRLCMKKKNLPNLIWTLTRIWSDSSIEFTKAREKCLLEFDWSYFLFWEYYGISQPNRTLPDSYSGFLSPIAEWGSACWPSRVQIPTDACLSTMKSLIRSASSRVKSPDARLAPRLYGSNIQVWWSRKDLTV